MPDRRSVVDAWVTAQFSHDEVALRRIFAHDVVVTWPQTGERLRGVENVLEVDRIYPGGLPEGTLHRVVGAEDRWVLDPTFVPRRIVGSGDVWVIEASLTYPSGDRYEYACVLELRDGLVVQQTEYWAPVGEPPAWRAHLVERI
jgi:ketosteroid isomerase-like protein